MKKKTRKIMKNDRGNYYVNIPKEVVRKLKWRENQKVVVENTGLTIIIKDWKK
jgi:bifunctional DNA-binding transcriptional regulator/antitoxin component of YhaV-PrlF toxin-antitoxin module